MKSTVSQWVLALGFLALPLGSLVLSFYLIHHPPRVADLPQPSVSQPETLRQLPDFTAIEPIPERKRRFFEMLLPMIEWRNQQLTLIREQIKALQQKLDSQGELTGDQRQKLDQLQTRFRVHSDNHDSTQAILDALLQRADIIPVEMALAQAAAESGWGTSRFAVQANNLFGQWCYRKGCGLVPRARSEGATHEVQKFDSVNDAVTTYFRNINTNHAYREVRQIRAQRREQGKPITGMALVEGLHRYSSRGQAYIEELKELIRYNDLENIHTQLAAAEEAQEDS